MVDREDEQVDWFKLAHEPVEKALVVRRRKDQPTRVRKEKLVLSPDRKVMTGRHGTVYRQIPTNPHYYISQEGVVKNLDGMTLRNRHTSTDSQVQLRIGVREYKLYRIELIHLAWPELAPRYENGSIFYQDEEFRVIEGFPDYIISRTGTVIRLKNWVKHQQNRGRYYISRDGKQTSRSYRRLVFENFGEVLE